MGQPDVGSKLKLNTSTTRAAVGIVPQRSEHSYVWCCIHLTQRPTLAENSSYPRLTIAEANRLTKKPNNIQIVRQRH